MDVVFHIGKSFKLIMLVMVLADVAFVSAEIVYYDKKTDYSNCCKQYKNFIPKGSRSFKTAGGYQAA